MKKHFLYSIPARSILIALLLVSQQTGAQQYDYGLPPGLPNNENITTLDTIEQMTDNLQSMHRTNALLQNTNENLGERPDPRIMAQEQASLANQGLTQLSQGLIKCLENNIEKEDSEKEVDDLFDPLYDNEDDEDEDEEQPKEIGGCEVPEEHDLGFFDQYTDGDDDLSCQDSFDIRKNYYYASAISNCHKKEISRLSGAIECFRNLEAGLLKAAQPLQNYISQQSGVIREQISLFDQGISAYEKSMALIDEDLEGDEGYKTRLKNIEEMAKFVDSAIDGAPLTSGAQSTPQALDERVRSFEDEERGNLATNWIRRVGERTKTCFKDQAQACSDRGDQTPSECYTTILTHGTGDATAQKAAAKYNVEILKNILTNFNTNSHFSDTQNYGELDPGNGEQLANIMNAEYEQLNGDFLDAIQIQGTFRGGSDRLVAKIRELATTHMRNCYNKEAKDFNDALSSNTVDESNIYNQEIQNYRNKKLILQKELNQLSDLITRDLTAFQTKFTKTFSSELRGFKEDCRSKNTVSNSYDCLLKLRDHLHSHIDGTGSEPPRAIMSVPSLTDKENPFKEVECVGFKDCINKLEVTRKSYREEKEKLEEEASSTISQHNNAIQMAVDSSGKVFSDAFSGPFIEGTRQFINAKLNSLGIVDASITSEKRSGEDLELEQIAGGDGAPSVYKIPKDVLSVMGTRAGLLKIGDIKGVKASIAKRLKDIEEEKAKNNKLRKAAENIEDRCKIDNIKNSAKT